VTIDVDMVGLNHDFLTGLSPRHNDPPKTLAAKVAALCGEEKEDEDEEAKTS